MAIAGTYATLQNRVMDELGDRSDLKAPLHTSNAANSPIKRAIQSAIAKWEREPFYFTEVYDTTFFTTVNNQEYYTTADDTDIPAIVSITRLHATIAGSRYVLIPRTWNYLDDISTGTTAGKPESYAYFASQIRLYPIPDGAYPIALSGHKRLAALSADTDTNAWTTDGFDLIRCEALLLIATEFLHDAALAGAMEVAIYGDPANPLRKGYLQALREETQRRARPGILRAAGDPPKGG